MENVISSIDPSKVDPEYKELMKSYLEWFSAIQGHLKSVQAGIGSMRSGLTQLSSGNMDVKGFSKMMASVLSQVDMNISTRMREINEIITIGNRIVGIQQLSEVT